VPGIDGLTTLPGRDGEVDTWGLYSRRPRGRRLAIKVKSSSPQESQMRPFEQADPNVQLMLVDRGNRARTLDRPRAAGRGSARRSAMSDALAAAAFTRLFPFVPLTRTELKRDRARTA
jgi:hypothetical protein